MTDKFTADNDPADFTVAQVAAFLDSASAEDAAAVKAAEQAGKARTGILEHAPSAKGVAPDEDGYTRVTVEDAYRPGEPIERDDEAADTQA